MGITMMTDFLTRLESEEHTLPDSTRFLHVFGQEDSAYAHGFGHLFSTNQVSNLAKYLAKGFVVFAGPSDRVDLSRPEIQEITVGQPKLVNTGFDDGLDKLHQRLVTATEDASDGNLLDRQRRATGHDN